MPRDDQQRSRSPSRWRERERERDLGTDRRRVEDGRDKEKDRERERDRDRRRGEDRDRGHERDRHRSLRDERRDRDGERERHRKRRSASTSSEELLDLTELGVSKITNDDFYIKTGEFRHWLKTERGKYLDELSSDATHKYFRRFVRRWNDGALPRGCYEPRVARASDNTRHKWEFAEHRSRVNSQELASVRTHVDEWTHSRRPPLESHVPSAVASDDGGIGPHSSRSPTPGPRLESDTADTEIGPAPSSLADRQYAREAGAAAEALERADARRSERRVALERAEDLAPRERGHEGKMAEKRAQNEENKKMREKDNEVELDEGTLMGDSNAFQAAIRARDAAAARRAEKKAEQQADLRSALEERMSERRDKESATMDMFKAIAKQRFG